MLSSRQFYTAFKGKMIKKMSNEEMWGILWQPLCCFKHFEIKENKKVFCNVKSDSFNLRGLSFLSPDTRFECFLRGMKISRKKYKRVWKFSFLRRRIRGVKRWGVQNFPVPERVKGVRNYLIHLNLSSRRLRNPPCDVRDRPVLIFLHSKFLYAVNRGFSSVEAILENQPMWP